VYTGGGLIKEIMLGGIAMLEQYKCDRLVVKKYTTRQEMGAAAAADAEQVIAQIIRDKGYVNMIFAAAPSQNEMLDNLLNSSLIDWSKVNAMHMDEYVGLPEGSPQSFGTYLWEHIFCHKQFQSIHYIRGNTENTQAECERYTALLREYPVDVVCLGIGENGHIAFNDPWVAEFADEKAVKVVQLDPVCRNQQVNDGCFAAIDDVPNHAITLTVPALMAARYMFCVVPSATKADAVRRTVCGPVTEDCPASILRTHGAAVLYCDADSGRDLTKEAML